MSAQMVSLSGMSRLTSMVPLAVRVAGPPARDREAHCRDGVRR